MDLSMEAEIDFGIARELAMEKLKDDIMDQQFQAEWSEASIGVAKQEMERILQVLMVHFSACKLPENAATLLDKCGVHLTKTLWNYCCGRILYMENLKSRNWFGRPCIWLYQNPGAMHLAS